MHKTICAILLLGTVHTCVCSTATDDGDGLCNAKDIAKWGHLYLRYGVSGIQFYSSAFSASFPCQELPLVLPKPNEQGCGNLTNTNINGSIVVAQRGVCSFMDKARNAQRYGAHALIVLNTQPGLLRMPGLPDTESMTLASAMVGKVHANLITEAIVNSRTWAMGPITGVLVGQRVNSGHEGGSRLAPCGACRDVGVGLAGSTPPSVLPTGDDGNEAPLAPVHGGFVEVRFIGSDRRRKLGPFEFLSATYSGPLSHEWRRLVVGSGQNELGCSPFVDVNYGGATVLLKRGKCMFTDKTIHAQNASAAAVILVNSVPGLQRVLGSYDASVLMHIPVVMICRAAGSALMSAVRGSGGVEVRIVSGKHSPTASDYDTLNRLSDMQSWPPDVRRRKKVVAAITEQILASNAVTNERVDMLNELAAEADQFYEHVEIDEI